MYTISGVDSKFGGILSICGVCVCVCVCVCVKECTRKRQKERERTALRSGQVEFLTWTGHLGHFECLS